MASHSNDPQKKSIEESSFENRLKSALLPFTVFVTVVSAILGFIANFEQIVERYEGDPVVVGTVIAIAICVVGLFFLSLFKLTISRRQKFLNNAIFVFVILALYGGLVAYPNRCIAFNWCEGGDFRPFRINFLWARAVAAETPALQMVNVRVDEARSTFRIFKDNQSIHAHRESLERISVEFDRELLPAFRSASCRGIRGEGPIEDALPIWRTLLKARNRNDLVRKLSNYAGYRDLVLKGGERGFLDARPTAAELAELQKSKPDWYALILRWMVECVGVADPVLIWTMRNNSGRALSLSSIEYDVLDVGQVKGAGPETIEPIDVQPHDLYHSIGKQIGQLQPVVRIGAGDTVAVRIRYRLQATDWGLTWLIRPNFVTLEGVSATGPEIKIFSAKNKKE